MGVDYSRATNGTIFAEDGDTVLLLSEAGEVHAILHFDQLDDIREYLSGNTLTVRRDWNK